MIGSRFGFFARQRQAVSLLLDDYPATAAYSLRKLRTDYSGAAIEVRIDTTLQPEYDIGFDSNGELDTADLLSKAGANDAYVTTWYDQSGNGDDLTNASASEQPQIVATGVLIVDNLLASMQFSGVQQLIKTSVPLNNLSIFMVMSSNQSATEMTALNLQDGANIASFHFNRSANDSLAYGVYNGTSSFEGGSTSGQILASGFSLSNADADLFIDGVDVNLAYQNRSNFGDSTLGSRSGTYWFDGKISEVIIYDTDESSNRTAIETNINDYYGIY